MNCHIAGIGPERASLKILALEAKARRVVQRQEDRTYKVEVNNIPGLPRSISLEENSTAQSTTSTENLSAIMEGYMDKPHPTMRTNSEPVMIQKISYT